MKPETYLKYKFTNMNKIVTYTSREIRVVTWKIASQIPSRNNTYNVKI